MMAGAILVLFGFIGFAFNQNRNVGPIMSRRNEGEREMTMKALVIFTAVCFSTSAYAQGAPPKAGNKPLVQVKPKEPMECKLVGRVKGTKLWYPFPRFPLLEVFGRRPCCARSSHARVAMDPGR
jgi:hypothetical protein